MSRLRVPAGSTFSRYRRFDVPFPLAAASGTAPPSVVVTAHATPHTKGNYAELTAATPAQASGIELFVGSMTNITGAVSGILLDLAFGSGPEVVKIPNIQVGGLVTPNGSWLSIGKFPLAIPKGTRLALASQSLTTVQAATIGYRLLGTVRGQPAPLALVALGADTATSQTTANPTIVSANVKSDWAQVTASTPVPLRGLVLCTCPTDNNQSNGVLSFDVGIGASGAEVVIVPDAYASATAAEGINLFDPGFYPVEIPAGTRVAVRMSASLAANASAGMSLIGIPA